MQQLLMMKKTQRCLSWCTKQWAERSCEDRVVVESVVRRGEAPEVPEKARHIITILKIENEFYEISVVCLHRRSTKKW